MRNKITFSILMFFLIYIILGLKPSNAANGKTMTIVLDPGHGGYESGAVNGSEGIIERDITLKTARYLKEYLEQYYGVTVIMTHNGLNSNSVMEVVERGMCARNNNADLFVSLHFNSAPVGKSMNGAEVFVTNSRLLYKYNQEASEIGRGILNNLSKLGIYNRGVKTRLCNDIGPKWEYSDGTKADYYGVIRYAMKGDAEDRGLNIASGVGITTVLVEHCFIQGSDVQYINSDEKLKKLAEADGKAIADHYGLAKNKPISNYIENMDMEPIKDIINRGKALEILSKGNILQNAKKIIKNN